MIHHVDVFDPFHHEEPEESGLGAIQTDLGCLPLKSLDVRAYISQFLAETCMRQVFRNATDRSLEATYIFPLPHRAAVSKMTILVEDRVIDARLMEREQARDEYATAVASGRRAAIAEEERSGVFTLRVGNIPSNADVVVELTLVAPLDTSDGEAEFRFPLVIAPRYTPGMPLNEPPVGLGTVGDTDQVPDASRVSPPVLLPGFPNPVQLSIQVDLDPSFLPSGNDFAARLRCSLHSVVVEENPRLRVKLKPKERLNRDFILRIPVATDQFATVLQVTPAGPDAEGVFGLTLFPAHSQHDRDRPRDVVFVLDRSGSMMGWKMIAARRALGRIIDNLRDCDRFSVLAFDHSIERPAGLSEELSPAANRHRWRILEWLGKLEARGGTEMGPALVEAVSRFSHDGDRRTLVVLVTDGQVFGEDAILVQLKQQLGDARPEFLTVGIDQAVNAAFLDRLTKMFGGCCELVESEDRLDDVLERIGQRISTPVLTNLRIEPINFELSKLCPNPIGSVVPGKSLTLFGRHADADTDIRMIVRADDATGEPWEQEVVGRKASFPASLLHLWGRTRVRELEDQYVVGGRARSLPLEQEIVHTSLESGVLSRFTAFVAVDSSGPVISTQSPLQVVQPVEYPANWPAPQAAQALNLASCHREMMSHRPLNLSMANTEIPRAKRPRRARRSQIWTGEPPQLTRLVKRAVATDAIEIRVSSDRVRFTSIDSEREERNMHPDSLNRIIAEIRQSIHLVEEDDTWTGSINLTLDHSEVSLKVVISKYGEAKRLLLVIEKVEPRQQVDEKTRKRFWK